MGNLWGFYESVETNPFPLPHEFRSLQDITMGQAAKYAINKKHEF